MVAAASIGGSVAVIDRKTRDLARTLVGPGLPVWSVAFLPDSRTLLTGGADNIIRRWNAVTGEPVDPLLLEAAGDPLAAYAGDRGAEIFRACVACHTLGAEQANRAGPTLAGIFGRRIATAPGYQFLRSAQAPRYRLDAGDGLKIVRDRACGLHAGHQDARAAHRLGAGSRRAGAVSRARDQAIDAVRGRLALRGAAAPRTPATCPRIPRSEAWRRRPPEISLPTPCRWSWPRGGRRKVNANAIWLWRRAGRLPRIRKSTDVHGNLRSARNADWLDHCSYGQRLQPDVVCLTYHDVVLAMCANSIAPDDDPIMRSKVDAIHLRTRRAFGADRSDRKLTLRVVWQHSAAAKRR